MGNIYVQERIMDLAFYNVECSFIIKNSAKDSKSLLLEEERREKGYLTNTITTKRLASPTLAQEKTSVLHMMTTACTELLSLMLTGGEVLRWYLG